MTDYRPISRRAYCADDRWRAIVEVVDGENRRQLEATVDLHDAAHPTIALPATADGTAPAPIAADASFVAAFRLLPAVPATVSRDQQQQICGQPPSLETTRPRPPAPVTPLALGAPVVGCFAQYYVDRFGRHDLNRIPAPDGFGTLGTTTNVLYIGSQALCVTSYIPIHRRLDPTWAWVMDGLMLGGSAAFGIAAAAQPQGEGTPELSTSLTLGSTAIPAMIYGNNETSRQPLRFWLGWGSQLGFGVLFSGLGFGGVGRRPTVPSSGMYAPSGMAGARGAAGNPYEGTQFPGIDTDMAILGVVQGTGAVINLIDYLANGTTPADRPWQVSAAPIRGGAALSLSGSF